MEERGHCTFANSVLARFRMGMSASAFSQTEGATRRPPDTRATDFTGASAIRATPITTSTADPTRKPTRWLAISSHSVDIATAWAKLDHAAKAITLRCADGFRTAISRKTPSAT
jgi:hypothetical protein